MRRSQTKRAGSEQRRSARRPTNISLPEALTAEARSLGINISQACERGLAREVAGARARLWLKENERALASSNEYVDSHGLPLARLRQF
jgi:antitoxin CcdA